MNYMTGQSLMYLMATVVAMIMLSVLILFMVGGSFSYNNKEIHVDNVTKIVGQTLTRNGGE